MTFSIDNFETGEGKETSKGSRGFAGETILELVENEAGQIVLRESDNVDDPLVTIDFSKKVQEMLGGDTQMIGHHMVQAAIQAVMSKQISQWHANVYDEEPERYS